MMHYGAGGGGGRVRSMILIAAGPGSDVRGSASARDAGIDAVVLDLGSALAAEDTALSADLLFAEISEDEGDRLDRMLVRMAGLARGGQAAIVSIVPELIDPAMAALGDAPVTILCSAGAATRAAAIALALADRGAGVRQDGVASGDALRAIGADLERIAERLVGLADGGPPAVRAVPDQPEATGIVVTAADYRRMLRERRLRDQYLGDDLFADPAWDMLLDLAAARLEGGAVAVSSLCIAAAVPPTTALRWIKALTDRGLLVRTPDPQDARRVFMTLSAPVADAMDGYVRAIRAVRDA